MQIKHILILVGVILVGLGVFGLDWYFAQGYKGFDALKMTTEKEKLLGFVEIPKNIITNSQFTLDKKISQNEVDIPIHKLQFYQKQYAGIRNINCNEFSKLKLERNYQMQISTYENTKILQGVKMFDLKFNENPDGTTK